MEKFLFILAMAWFSNMFTWGIEMEWFVYVRDKYLKYKIFQCTKCFAFWSTYSFYLLCREPFEGLIIALVVSLVSAVIEKIVY